MWGRAGGAAPGGLRVLLLLLLPPGSMGLQCLHCGSDAGSCRGAELVTCPTGSDVCVEALGAVAWSHGRFWLGGRGCGRGQPGSHARALQLAGLVLFSRRCHCREGRGCNAELPLGQEEALPDVAPASPAPPNGLRCFGCPDDGACSRPRVVPCAGPQRACFHGNATLTLGGRRLWREVRGCASDANCSESARGDGDAALSGSCCHGDLCNGPPGLFQPHLPRLQLLPHGHAHTATPTGPSKMAATPKMAATRANMAAGGSGVNGDVMGVNSDVMGVNGDVNGDVNGRKDGANMAAAGGDGDVIKVNGDVIKVNGDVVEVNGDVVEVNGSNMGVNGDVNGDVNGGKDGANMAAGGNGDVSGVSGDVIKVNGSVNGVNVDVNGDIIGVNGDVKGVNGSISGVNSDVTGVTSDVIRVSSDVIGVNGSINGDVNGDKAKVNMAAGVNGSVTGVGDDVTKVNGDVSGDVSAKMAAGDKMAAGRSAIEGKGGTKGPVGRGHPVGGASWLLPLLLWPLL